MPPATGPSEPSRGPRAIVEENLPLGALYFERGPFLGRTRLGPGSLAERDERERIPFPARSKFSFRNPVQNLSRGPRELRERRMRADLPEPVRRISNPAPGDAESHATVRTLLWKNPAPGYAPLRSMKNTATDPPWLRPRRAGPKTGQPPCLLSTTDILPEKRAPRT